MGWHFICARDANELVDCKAGQSGTTGSAACELNEGCTSLHRLCLISSFRSFFNGSFRGVTIVPFVKDACNYLEVQTARGFPSGSSRHTRGGTFGCPALEILHTSRAKRLLLMHSLMVFPHVSLVSACHLNSIKLLLSVVPLVFHKQLPVQLRLGKNGIKSFWLLTRSLVKARSGGFRGSRIRSRAFHRADPPVKFNKSPGKLRSSICIGLWGVFFSSFEAFFHAWENHRDEGPVWGLSHTAVGLIEGRKWRRRRKLSTQHAGRAPPPALGHHNLGEID